MKSGCQIPWNAIAICRMSQTSWQTGNLNLNDDLVNHSKDQLCYLSHWLDIFSERDKARIHRFGRKLLRGILLVMPWSRGELEGRHSDCRYWKIGKVGCIRKLSQKTECKRSPDNPKRWTICNSYGRWFSNIVRLKLRIPRTHSETGTHRKERESQRRISWRKGRGSISRNKRWRGSSRTLLVYSRRVHLSSSYWTQGSIVRADKRIISYSTELNWCQQVNLCRSGDFTRRTTGWILGMLTTTEICQSHGLDFTRFTLLNEAPQKGCKQSGRRLTRIQTTSHPDHICRDARTRIVEAIEKLLTVFPNMHTGNRCSKKRQEPKCLK